MLTLTHNTLEFSFPDVHPDAKCSIDFQRTLRIPDDNQKYSLPPGFGSFPLLHVEDYASTTPKTWQERGGVFLPMYQAEALWVGLGGRWGDNNYPCAVKIAAGKINAVTGEPWENSLSADPQDYVVIPRQPWLDGFCVGDGLIRQFVAMPLGEGFTAEEQLTGKADFGGIQICVYPMKRERYEKLFYPRRHSRSHSWSQEEVCYDMSSCMQYSDDDFMGLAPGGLMTQEIYGDVVYGIDAWDTAAMSRCFVHLANSKQYLDITGHIPPTKPPSAKEYTDAGMPWFDYYAADKIALKGAKTLAELDSIAAKEIKLGQKVLDENEPVNPTQIVSIGTENHVNDGTW